MLRVDPFGEIIELLSEPIHEYFERVVLSFRKINTTCRQVMVDG